MNLENIINQPWVDIILIFIVNFLPTGKRSYNLYLGMILLAWHHYLPLTKKKTIHHSPFVITSTIKNSVQYIMVDCYGNACAGNTTWRWIIQKMHLKPQTRLELINCHIWHDILFFSLPKEISREHIVIHRLYGPTIIKHIQNDA